MLLWMLHDCWVLGISLRGDMGLRKGKCCTCHQSPSFNFDPEQGRGKSTVSMATTRPVAEAAMEVFGERYPLHRHHVFSWPAWPKPKGSIAASSVLTHSHLICFALTTSSQSQNHHLSTTSLFPMSPLSWVASPL